jgi:hypothetical protein
VERRNFLKTSLTTMIHRSSKTVEDHGTRTEFTAKAAPEVITAANSVDEAAAGSDCQS